MRISWPGPARGWAPLAAAAVLSFCACTTPENVKVCLYENSGPRLLEIEFTNLSRHGAGQGMAALTAPDGEKFRGNWLRIRKNQSQSGDNGSDNYSMPSLKAYEVQRNWGRDSDFGIDFDQLSKNYGIFVMCGDKGTRLDGIFVFNGPAYDWTSIVGTARDNKGRKYRVIGQNA